MSYVAPRMGKLALTSIAIASTLACVPAFAQDASKLERVEVTGSNIKRLSAETASAVQVVSRSEIKQSGANTLRQILDTVTATSNEIRDDGNTTSFSAGATGVSLRGLGKAATLVLLNGRRVAQYALADGAQITFTNVDSIPADVIERIEILLDGASAVYGSDAMAGVINIITRKDYNGVGLSANYQTGISPNVGKQVTAGVVAGFGDMAKDRFNVMANLELYKREGYMLSDIKDSYAPWHKAIVNPAFGDPSVVSYPGNIIKGSIVNGSFTQASSAFRTPVAGCKTTNAAGACTSDLNPLTQSSDPAKRANLFVAGRMAVSNDIEAFAEVTYSKTETEYLGLPFGINAPGTPYKWFDGNAKQVQIVNKPLLSTTNPANTTGGVAGLEYRFMDNLNMWSTPTEASQYRALVGARGSFGNWDWETSIGRTGAEGTKAGIGAHRTGFINAISSGDYKIGGTNSQELLDRMFQRNELAGKNHTNVIDAKLSGELFRLPAGAVQGAFGFEHRDESVLMKSSQNLLNAEIIGVGSVWVEGSRKLDAAFAEIEAPLFKGLTANAALRFDKSSGFEGRTSPKASLRYEVMPQLLLRGTVAGGFRAPNIPETMGKVGLTGFFNSTVDPKRCETATRIRDILRNGDANDKQEATLAYNSGCLVSVPAMISSNASVKPELSRSATFGFVLEPTKDLTIAVDYFSIERRDEISYRDPSYVLDREDEPGYSSLVARIPVSSTDLARAARANQLSPGANISWAAGDLVTLLLQYENLLKTKSSGIDLDVKGRVGLGEMGRLSLGLQATYLLKSQAWDIDENTYLRSTVGNRNNPRLKAVISTTWAVGNWTTGLRLNYTSAQNLYNDQFDQASWSAAACKTRLNPGDLPCYRMRDWRTDLNVRYTGFKNLSLGLNIGNLWGAEFPVNLRDGYTIRPRTIKVGAEYKF